MKARKHKGAEQNSIHLLLRLTDYALPNPAREQAG